MHPDLICYIANKHVYWISLQWAQQEQEILRHVDDYTCQLCLENNPAFV